MKLSSFFCVLLVSSVHGRPWWAGGRGGQGGGSSSSGGTLENSQEEDDLLYMREEEKMARDVYRSFFELFGDSIFSNIASSEQQHMNRMLDMIETYGLTDPVPSDDIGIFDDSNINELYDSLILQGQASLLDALKVGALIEEVDIADLREAIADSSETRLVRVYGNLERASENHLRAFASRIKAMTGDSYEAQKLEQEDVDSILGA
jgi:hypothetical protein